MEITPTRRNYKSKNKSFKPTQSTPKVNKGPKSRMNFKKTLIEDSISQKTTKFSALLNNPMPLKKETPPFLSASVLEGRVPYLFKSFLTKLYKVKNDKDISLKELKNSITDGFNSQKRISSILEKASFVESSLSEDLESLPMDSEVKDTLLNKISHINLENMENETEREVEFHVINGYFKMPKEKYTEKNEKIKDLRFKLESEIDRSIPTIVDISFKRKSFERKDLSTFSYYKS